MAGGGCAFDVLALANEHGSSYGIWEVQDSGFRGRSIGILAGWVVEV